MRDISKKLGIVTLHGYHNYGNKLQNYTAKGAKRSRIHSGYAYIKHPRTPLSAIYDKAKNISTVPLESIAMVTRKLKSRTISREHKELVDSE